MNPSTEQSEPPTKKRRYSRRCSVTESVLGVTLEQFEFVVEKTASSCVLSNAPSSAMGRFLSLATDSSDCFQSLCATSTSTTKANNPSSVIFRGKISTCKSEKTTPLPPKISMAHDNCAEQSQVDRKRAEDADNFIET